MAAVGSHLTVCGVKNPWGKSRPTSIAALVRQCSGLSCTDGQRKNGLEWRSWLSGLVQCLCTADLLGGLYVLSIMLKIWIA